HRRPVSAGCVVAGRGERGSWFLLVVSIREVAVPGEQRQTSTPNLRIQQTAGMRGPPVWSSGSCGENRLHGFSGVPTGGRAASVDGRMRRPETLEGSNQPGQQRACCWSSLFGHECCLYHPVGGWETPHRS